MTPSDPIEFSRSLGSKGEQRCGNRVQLEDGNANEITNQNPLPVDSGWSIQLTSLEGPNNNDKTTVVASGRNDQILYIWVEFVSNATVGDRQLVVEIQDAANDVIAQFVAGAIQAASLTRNYMFAPSLADLTAFRDTNYLQTPIPPTLILDEDYTVRVYDNNNVSAQDDMVVQLSYARKIK